MKHKRERKEKWGTTELKLSKLIHNISHSLFFWDRICPQMCKKENTIRYGSKAHYFLILLIKLLVSLIGLKISLHWVGDILSSIKDSFDSITAIQMPCPTICNRDLFSVQYQMPYNTKIVLFPLPKFCFIMKRLCACQCANALFNPILIPMEILYSMWFHIRIVWSEQRFNGIYLWLVWIWAALYTSAIVWVISCMCFHNLWWVSWQVAGGICASGDALISILFTKGKINSL